MKAASAQAVLQNLACDAIFLPEIFKSANCIVFIHWLTFCSLQQCIKLIEFCQIGKYAKSLTNKTLFIQDFIQNVYSYFFPSVFFFFILLTSIIS